MKHTHGWTRFIVKTADRGELEIAGLSKKAVTEALIACGSTVLEIDYDLR